ncbi:MAG: hypothetical protein U0Y10_21380 [Spirosomataceae bacterium]
MKNFLLLLVLLALVGCKKNEEIIRNSQFLKQITARGKPFQTFEYTGNLLVKENVFGVCEKSPADEYFYTYQGVTLSKLQSVLRSIYSSTVTMCNPASPGELSEETFEYDSQNRLIKVSRQKSYTLYSYNAQGQVEKLTLYGGTNPLTTSFKYDAKGNIIETTDYSGYVTQYEYDDKINPFYLINQKPSWISPFNKSPNNITKIIGSQGNYVRNFTYNALGLPSEMEENGQTYYFEYF